MKPENRSAKQPAIRTIENNLNKSKVGYLEHQSFKKLAAESFKEWAETTTGHGAPHLIRSKRWYQKLIWVISILVAIGLCLFMVTQSILQYLEYKVITRIRVEEHEEMVFPVVSFCQLYRWESNKAFWYIKNYYDKTYNLSEDKKILYNFYITKLVKDGVINENDSDWLFYKTFDPEYNDSFRQQMGLNVRESFSECTFNSKPCNLSEMEWWYSTYYGNCYKFNSGRDNRGNPIPLKKMKQKEEGLNVEFYIGLSAQWLSGNNYLLSPKTLGCTILVEDHENFPIRETGVYAQPGTMANIALKKTVSKSLPYPYGNCVAMENIDTILSREMKTLGLKYNRRNCMNLCEQKQNIDKLGCYSLRLPKILNAPACSNRSQYDRLRVMEYNDTICDDLCPFECENTEFGLEISYAGINLQYPYWKRPTMVPISIKFNELTTTTIEESAALSIVDLVAYIGGTLGLFVGISVLTFTEVVVLMIDFYMFLGFQKSQKAKNNFIQSQTAPKNMKLNNIFALKPGESANQGLQKPQDINSKEEGFIQLALVAIKEWAQETTGHGLPHLIRCKRWDQRIIWAISIFIAIGLCTFMVYKAILQYLEFGVVTQIRVHSEETMTFPVVSFCANPFVSSESSSFLIAYHNYKFNSSINSYEEAFYDLNKNDTDWLFYSTFDPSYNDSFRKQFGFPDWRAFLKCTFNSKPCNLSEIEWWYSPTFGNCYKFNSGRDNQGNSVPLKTVQQPENGLYVEFFLGQSHYRWAYWQYRELGVNIIIEDQDNFPIDQTGTFAQPNKMANIVLKKTVSKSLPYPYGNCVAMDNIDTILSREMETLGLRYNRRNCMNLCEQKQNIEKLGCYSLRLPKILNAPPCSNRSQYDRLRVMEYDKTICDDLCPFECEKTKFEQQISYADFPSRNYLVELYEKNRTYWDSFFPKKESKYPFEQMYNFQYKMLPVLIYFDGLSTTTIEESAALSIVDLVAYIGGTLGLFVGISVLTFTEVVVLMIDITYFLMPHASRKNSKTNRQSQTAPKNMKLNKKTVLKPGESADQALQKPQNINSKEEGFKQLALVAFKEWAEGTTGHGLPNLIRSKRWYQRIIWAISIFISIGLCSFMVYKSIFQYLEFDVVTQIRVQSEETMTFPVVSFCNINPWASNKSFYYIKDYYDTTYNQSFLLYEQIFRLVQSGVIDENDSDWLFYKTFDPEFDDAFRKQFEFEATFHNCTFNSKPCNLSEMEWWYSPIYGNCYKFNSGRDNQGNKIPLKTIKNEKDGLYVEFFIGLSTDIIDKQPIYTENGVYFDYILVQNRYLLHSKTLGITILVEDQENFPIRKTGVYAQAASMANIALKKTVSKSLPYPYGNCVAMDNIDTILSREMETLGLKYNRRNCMNLCEQKQNIEKLGCYSLRLPKILNAPPCSNRSQYDRLRVMEYNDTICDDLCPFECENTEFGLEISYSEFPSYNYYLDELVLNYDYWHSLFPSSGFDEFKNSLVPFSIYFDELTTTTIEESAALSVVDLVAYIGGTLGLFVGISVLTFTEVIVLIIDMIFFFLKTIS